MSSLDSTFAELRVKLQSIDRVSPTHIDPFFHFVHAPEETAALVDRIRRWKASLQSDGWKVRVVSLAEEMWRVIDESGRWEDWREVEADAEPAQAITAVADTLRTKQGLGQGGLAKAILDVVSDDTPDRLVLLTDAALLHPFFRVRVIEEVVHDRVRAPTVLFYPGSRAGEFGLRFLGIYPEDPNYRSNIVGGER
ncbi:protein of unknown function [Stigmatella aurantiaca]|uniref:DUF1788 domain-containing protein n=1 Tax=Stigmatella aurantiaca TaxID=41 RepID=A0A1H8BNM8_STIAU|nr:BREX protein BrxB domain-containing protein [Stigmatella aurantiaca]SEM84129.1 protein of unknown function [Stigmatella aurantiaca]